MLTKGKTDRLSAESMLKYFHPLELWLKGQNRDETVIGWEIRQEDTALFQPMEFNASDSIQSRFFHLVFVFAVVLGLCF